MAAAFLLAVLNPLLCVGASDTDVGAGEMTLYIPDEIRALLPSDIFSEDGAALPDDGGLSIIFDTALGTLGKNAADIAVFAAEVLGILLLCAAFTSFDKLRANYSGVADFASAATLALIMYKLTHTVFLAVQGFLGQLHAFGLGTLGIQLGLYVAQGNTMTSAAAASSSSVILFIVQLITDKILLPLFSVCFGFSLLGCFGDIFNFSSVVGQIRNSLCAILSFLATVVSAVMIYQQKLAQSADTLASRSIRFASSGLVPFVGSALGEATRAVMASVSLVKNSVGALGILVILLIVMSPLVLILAYKLILKLLMIIAGIFDLKRQAALIGECAALFDIALAVVIFSSVIVIFIFGMLIATDAAFAA